MSSKTIDIPSDVFAKLVQIDSSMKHWSVRHTELTLQVNDALSHFSSLSQAKQGIIASLSKEADIDPNDVVEAYLTSEGGKPRLEVNLRDKDGQESESSGS
jgi:hypothetical protein